MARQLIFPKESENDEPFSDELTSGDYQPLPSRTTNGVEITRFNIRGSSKQPTPVRVPPVCKIQLINNFVIKTDHKFLTIVSGLIIFEWVRFVILKET